MSERKTRRESLVYHAKPKPGKIEVIPTKKYSTQRHLALAYSPGVASPCLEIYNDINNIYKYTNKGNLVAVISNGTAVLGLGDIGPEASKPVMEGKGLLFKIFAGIDVFDIEIDAKNVPISKSYRYSIPGLPSRGYEAGSKNPGAISKVFGESKSQKLSSNSLISSGLLYTGIINEKSLAIIHTNLKK